MFCFGILIISYYFSVKEPIVLMENNFFASKLQNENQTSDKKYLILILKNVFLKCIFQVLFISV